MTISVIKTAVMAAPHGVSIGTSTVYPLLTARGIADDDDDDGLTRCCSNQATPALDSNID